jgi:hypothetical protein
MVEDGSSNHLLTWKRRTRIGGDNWQALDVPLGEESEAYIVRIVQGDEIKAEYTVSTPLFAYTPAMRAADGIVGPYRTDVSQISALIGPGPFRGLDILA